MIFRFSGVSFLVLLAMLNGGDLYAGKGKKGDDSTQASATKAKQKSDAAAVVEFNRLHDSFSKVFSPVAIDVSTPLKDLVYIFRSELSSSLKPLIDALRNDDHATLVGALTTIYTEKQRFDDHFERYLYSASDPVDLSLDITVSASEIPSVMMEFMKEGKVVPMTFPISALQNQYLKELIQMEIRGYLISYFQYFFLRQIRFTDQDQKFFGEIENLLRGSKFQREFLVVMHEFAHTQTNLSHSSMFEALIGSQSVFNVPEDILAMNLKSGIMSASLVHPKKPENELRSRLLKILTSPDKMIIVVDHVAAFENQVKSLGLDPTIHTFDKYVKTLILGRYREAILFKTTSALAEAILKQQSENDGIDLRDPVTLVRNLSIPETHQDRPRLDPLQFSNDMKRLEVEMEVFKKDFEAALQNRENLRGFLEKFFRIKSEAQVPFARYSGPLHPVDGKPTHFEDGLVSFDEEGNSIHAMPQMVLVRPAVGTQEGIRKAWEKLTVSELQDAYGYLYTRYLTMFMNQWIHRLKPEIDEMSLEGLIQSVFGDDNLKRLKSLAPDDQQRLMAEMSFYILESGRGLLSNSTFLEKIPFLSRHGVDLNKCTHVIFPLPDDKKPVSKFYESMKNILSDENVSPSGLRKNWGVLCNVEAAALHQLVDDLQGSTLLRMAYKFFLFAKQMEEYVSGIRLLEAHKITADTIPTMKNEIVGLMAEMQTHKRNLSETRLIARTALVNLDASKAELAKKTQELERKAQQLANNIEREQGLQRESSALKKENKILEGKLEKLQAELESAQDSMKEVSLLQERIHDLELQIQQNEKVSSGKQKAVERLETETRKLKQGKEALEKNLHEQEERHAVIADEKANLEMTIAELRIQLAAQGEEVANLEGQLRSNQRSYEEREHLEATVEDLTRQLKAHEEMPVFNKDSTRKKLMAGVKAHQEIAEQLVDDVLGKLETATSAEEKTEILTDLGKRLALLELTGNYIPSGGANAALQQAKDFEAKRKAENTKLEAENVALKKQLQEAIAALQKLQAG